MIDFPQCHNSIISTGCHTVQVAIARRMGPAKLVVEIEKKIITIIIIIILLALA